MTNQEFSDRVGIHFSMASRIRAGKRLPSADLLHRIHREFKVPLNDLHQARNEGAVAFGRLIRERVFKEQSTAA